jgi:tRNA (guanine37-N1)-methyltransferase
MRWNYSKGHPTTIRLSIHPESAMRIHVITIFPELFPAALSTGIIGRARKAGLVDVRTHDLRDFTHDRHRTVDDSPYGGGPGMVMRPEPFFAAVGSLGLPTGSPVVLLSPQGPALTQTRAEQLAQQPVITLLCGRYEGVDERVRSHLATEALSIGDFVLTGGELPALVVVDSIVRLLPGALGHGDDATEDDTFTSGLVQHPQYTRPVEFRGLGVPEVLTSGDHARVGRWRRHQALQRTLEQRPDLLESAHLTTDDLAELRRLGWNGSRESAD